MDLEEKKVMPRLESNVGGGETTQLSSPTEVFRPEDVRPRESMADYLLRTQGTDRQKVAAEESGRLERDTEPVVEEAGHSKKETTVTDMDDEVVEGEYVVLEDKKKVSDDASKRDFGGFSPVGGGSGGEPPIEPPAGTESKEKGSPLVGEVKDGYCGGAISGFLELGDKCIYCDHEVTVTEKIADPDSIDLSQEKRIYGKDRIEKYPESLARFAKKVNSFMQLGGSDEAKLKGLQRLMADGIMNDTIDVDSGDANQRD